MNTQTLSLVVRISGTVLLVSAFSLAAFTGQTGVASPQAFGLSLWLITTAFFAGMWADHLRSHKVDFTSIRSIMAFGLLGVTLFHEEFVRWALV